MGLALLASELGRSLWDQPASTCGGCACSLADGDCETQPSDWRGLGLAVAPLASTWKEEEEVEEEGVTRGVVSSLQLLASDESDGLC